MRCNYCGVEDARNTTRQHRDVAEHPLAFWSFMIEFVPHISRIALRLFRTPCNSVPSERSFSVQNAIHDNVRNRLLPTRTDKLIYIYMNRRVWTGKRVIVIAGIS